MPLPHFTLYLPSLLALYFLFVCLSCLVLTAGANVLSLITLSRDCCSSSPLPSLNPLQSEYGNSGQSTVKIKSMNGTTLPNLLPNALIGSTGRSVFTFWISFCTFLFHNIPNRRDLQINLTCDVFSLFRCRERRFTFIAWCRRLAHSSSIYFILTQSIFVCLQQISSFS